MQDRFYVAASRAAIEINDDPHRLDLEPRWIRCAHERDIHIGIAMARRGCLQPSDILNTSDAAAFIDAVHP